MDSEIEVGQFANEEESRAQSLASDCHIDHCTNAATVVDIPVRDTPVASISCVATATTAGQAESVRTDASQPCNLPDSVQHCVSSQVDVGSENFSPLSAVQSSSVKESVQSENVSAPICTETAAERRSAAGSGAAGSGAAGSGKAGSGGAGSAAAGSGKAGSGGVGFIGDGRALVLDGNNSVGTCSDLLACSDDDIDNQCDAEEPFLKYERLGADLALTLVAAAAGTTRHQRVGGATKSAGDCVTCLCVHAKFLVLGTASGSVHLFDHLGHRVGPPHQWHALAVNQLATTVAGDYLASCSDDGVAHVAQMAGAESVQRITLDTPVRTIALDPLYGATSGAHRLVVGGTRVLLYERTTFLARTKTSVLYADEAGTVVQAMRWCGALLAWACAGEVRVYHVDAGRLVSVVLSDVGARPQQYRCHLHWLADGCRLAVGWRNKVQLARLCDRSGPLNSGRLAGSGASDAARWYMEIVYIFHTDFVVGGVASGEGGAQLILLSVDDESGSSLSRHATGGACAGGGVSRGLCRPQMRVIKPLCDDYEELSADELSIDGYQRWGARQYHMESLADEGVVFVLAPSDLIVARERDADDHIDWLLEQREYESALRQLQRGGATVRRHSLLELGRKYLDSLLHNEHYELAASQCGAILGRSRQLWEEEVYRYAAMRQLPAISDHLPCSADFRLSSTIYEMVLYQFLRTDPASFLALVRRWPPTLYHCGAVINAALEQLLRDVDNSALLESLALLYGHQSRHDKALAVYLRLGHRSVFQLARRHQLHALLAECAATLAAIDGAEAVELLCERPDVTSCDVVVGQLESRPPLLFAYLCRLHHRHRARAAKYQDRLVELYAQLQPQQLLMFLRSGGGSYSLQRALDVCQSRLLVPETVYLLGRTGATRQALQLIMAQLDDIDGAIAFCVEHGDLELWDDLIALCLHRPPLVHRLLVSMGAHVDPQRLLRRLPAGMRVPGLRDALLHMLHERRAQLALRHSGGAVLVADCYRLHRQLARAASSALPLDGASCCAVCAGRLFVAPESMLMFHCGHAVHQDCLGVQSQACPVCRNRT